MNQESQRRKVMKRKVSDNKYLHKDFHVSMNILLKYIYNNFGREEMVNYLTQYADAYYKPVNDELMSGSISALCKYFTDIYAKEEWPVKRLVNEPRGAYSSLGAGRPGTPGVGMIYLLFEDRFADMRSKTLPPDATMQVARFNLSWILEGELTGNGTVPDWLK